MGSVDLKDDEILRFFLERSLFSARQFDIIYRRVHGRRDEGISRGAYYRLLKQSREKVEGVVYSMLLLAYIGALDRSRRGVLVRLLEQVDVISQSDAIAGDVIRDVIDVIDRLVRSMSRI